MSWWAEAAPAAEVLRAPTVSQAMVRWAQATIALKEPRHRDAFGFYYERALDAEQDVFNAVFCVVEARLREHLRFDPSTYPRPEDEMHVEIVTRLRELCGYAPAPNKESTWRAATAICRTINVYPRGSNLHAFDGPPLAEAEPAWVEWLRSIAALRDEALGQTEAVYTEPEQEEPHDPSMFRSLCDGDEHRLLSVDLAKSLGGSWWNKSEREGVERASVAANEHRERFHFVTKYVRNRRRLLAEQRQREVSEAALEHLKRAAIEREKEHAKRYGAEYGAW